jgi:hypothetical protein
MMLAFVIAIAALEASSSSSSSSQQQAWWSSPWLPALALVCPAVLACRQVFGRPASYPGTARVDTDGRQPQWPKGADRFGFPAHKLKVDPGWYFIEAAASHKVTEAVVGNGFKLAGESAGRQMWFHESELPNSSGSGSGRSGSSSGGGGFDGDSLMQAAGPAAGLGGPAFVTAQNPNTADLLFRRQMGSRWAEKDKALAESAAANAQAKAQAEAVVGGGGGGFNVQTGHRAAKPDESDVVSSLRKGINFYQTIQCEDGHYAGDYGGPMFLMPGLVVVWYVTGKLECLISPAKAKAMCSYIRNHQQLDGGWGTHIESPSTMFGSTLNYVALRLLGGAERDDAAMVAGRAFLRKHGGALHTASWAKLWLCVLGCMEWEGHNPVPPEMWLLPHWTPFHPGRLWCHCRMVYLPMCYLYGTKFVYSSAEADPLVLSLREELYLEGGPGYNKQPWDASRHWVADVDNYSPMHPLMAVSQTLLRHTWERFGGWAMRSLRKRGLEYAVEYMHAEDLQTNFVNIGPVNKVWKKTTMHILSFWYVSCECGGLSGPPIAL